MSSSPAIRVRRTDRSAAYTIGEVHDHIISAPTPSSTCRLPLAAVTAGTLNYDALYEMFRETGLNRVHTDLRMMLNWIRTTSLADRLQKFLESDDTTSSSSTVGETTTITQQLKIAVTVRPEHYRNLRLVTTAFLVPKSDNVSSRFIWNGKKFDKLFKRAGFFIPRMPTLDIRNAIIKLLDPRWKFVTQTDFRSWFFQFALHPSISHYFGFRINDALLRMIVLPQGIGFSPALAQHTSLFIASYVASQLQRRQLNIEYDFVIWIDNIILLTRTAADATTVKNVFDETTARLNIAKKPWEDGSNNGTTTTALGLDIDLRQQILRPSSRLVHNFVTAQQNFVQRPTAQNFFSVTGSIIWLAFIGRIPLCFASAFMHLLRATSRQALHEQSRIWANDYIFDREQIQTVNAAADLVNNVVITPFEHPCASLRAYTDASTTALAGFVFDTTQQLPDPRSIYIVPIASTSTRILPAELLAGALLSILRRHVQHEHDDNAVWITDNRSAHYAIIKGHSSSDICDRVLRLWLAHGAMPTHTQWVDTTSMPADKLTRADKYPTTIADLQPPPAR
jgi:hypothetical protein